MKKYLVPIIAVLFISISFTMVKDKNPLHSVWLFERYDDDVITYIARSSFKKDQGGMAIKSNGVLTVKQNASGCGTPPITYETVNGTWEMENDSVIVFKYTGWRGEMMERGQILSVTKNRLQLKVLPPLPVFDLPRKE